MPSGAELVEHPAKTINRANAAKASRRTWHSAHIEDLTFGQRAADVMRNAMGSWPFIAVLISLMLAWALINTLALSNSSWDPYPYILLNLGLSMLAGLQGAILLIAAKRQDGISAAMALHDFETDTLAKQEIDRLIQLSEQQLAITLDLQKYLRGQVVHEPAIDPCCSVTESLSRTTSDEERKNFEKP